MKENDSRWLSLENLQSSQEEPYMTFCRMHILLSQEIKNCGIRIGVSQMIFFYDNPVIADKYGLVTCINGYPIGFVTWDPRNIPEYVEIGHNGIRSAYKRKGYGHLQMEEAIRRIKTYDGLNKIVVMTNSNFVAPKNYESVGFKLYDRKKNDSESAYTGDYLYYEIIL